MSKKKPSIKEEALQDPNTFILPVACDVETVVEFLRQIFSAGGAIPDDVVERMLAECVEVDGDNVYLQWFEVTEQ